ncbi:MAG: DUF5995 family protein [Bacteroidia bacterium]|nr:DUF5995 family protein [Bacteroidia bacterium]
MQATKFSPETPPQTIDQVLTELDEIIEHATAKNDFLGIFAYIYRRTTAEVKRAIDNREFEDNARMEKFDVTFAGFYINAYWQYRRGERPCRSWMASFLAENRELSIMQHLFMGMNAHINFDLGQVAAKLATGAQIYALEKDFMKVNDILQSLIDEMQSRLGRSSFLFKVADWMGGRHDELLIDANMRQARQRAWDFACKLAFLEDSEKEAAIEALDKEVEKLARKIRTPDNYFVGVMFRLIHRFEEKNIQKIIQKLSK